MLSRIVIKYPHLDRELKNSKMAYIKIKIFIIFV
jgi:hypothetical protein